MAPFLLEPLLGKPLAYLIYLLIGFGFGTALEISGFASSPKLAGQFYFKDMTVLKVMFTGIIVAMVLIFWSSALGLLNYNLIWVNPTYLWPGIVGGLIMGAGFIIGGFCPGTSLVALATLKIDGFFFALGALTGIFFFGETVQYFDRFWHSSYMGRFTLPQLFGLPTGLVVFLIVLMALVMFWGADKLEQFFGGKPAPSRSTAIRTAAAGATLLAASVALMVYGQPTTAEKWAGMADEKEALLTERAVQIAPAELLDYIYNDKVIVKVIDVRDEANYNVFHIVGAESIPLADLSSAIPDMLTEPENTLFVTVSNDETLATDAWRTMAAESVPNVYILAGGINNWLDTFAGGKTPVALNSVTTGNEELRYPFDAAVGAMHPAADPDPNALHLEYIPKVEMKLKQGPSGGGCG
ncbi:MAG: YeeE/YedE family protein [Caldilineaceae bacterium]|nr:YeeE/YedE family protein [Caldilineaceae bacterium]